MFRTWFNLMVPCWDTGDVPMSRVKMNAKHEYEFLANYKIMQNVFKVKKIDKVRLFSPVIPMVTISHVRAGSQFPWTN